MNEDQKLRFAIRVSEGQKLRFVIRVNEGQKLRFVIRGNEGQKTSFVSECILKIGCHTWYTPGGIKLSKLDRLK